MRQSQRFINAITRSQRPHTKMKLKRLDSVRVMGAVDTLATVWHIQHRFSHLDHFSGMNFPIYHEVYIVGPYIYGADSYTQECNLVRW